jgi:hypothetical protein
MKLPRFAAIILNRPRSVLRNVRPSLDEGRGMCCPRETRMSETANVKHGNFRTQSGATKQEIQETQFCIASRRHL